MAHGMCSIDGCGKPAKACGWCSMHYERWRLYRSTDARVRVPNRLYDLNVAYFDEVDTPEKAYWLGMLSGDGCVTASGCVSLRLVDSDVDHVRAFGQAVGSGAPVRFYCGRSSKTKSGTCRYAALSITCRHMADALAAHGILPNKTLVLEPWSGPANLMPHYWRGLVDADGTIMATPGQWEIKLIGTKPVVQAFSEWVREQIPCKAHVLPVGKIWAFRVRGRVRCRALACVLYPEDCPAALERKVARANKLVAAGPSYRVGHPTSPQTRLLLSRVAGRKPLRAKEAARDQKDFPNGC